MGAILAPWLLSGALAALLVTLGAAVIVIFFMWLDMGCALMVIWAIGTIVLLAQCTGAP